MRDDTERDLVAVRDSLDEAEFMEKIALKNGTLEHAYFRRR